MGSIEAALPDLIVCAVVSAVSAVEQPQAWRAFRASAPWPLKPCGSRASARMLRSALRSHAGFAPGTRRSICTRQPRSIRVVLHVARTGRSADHCDDLEVKLLASAEVNVQQPGHIGSACQAAPDLRGESLSKSAVCVRSDRGLSSRAAALDRNADRAEREQQLGADEASRSRRPSGDPTAHTSKYRGSTSSRIVVSARPDEAALALAVVSRSRVLGSSWSPFRLPRSGGARAALA